MYTTKGITHKSGKDVEVKAYPLTLFCDVYHVGPTKVREEIAAGRLRAVKVGAKLLIPAESADAWFAALPTKDDIGMGKFRGRRTQG